MINILDDDYAFLSPFHRLNVEVEVLYRDEDEIQRDWVTYPTLASAFAASSVRDKKIQKELETTLPGKIESIIEKVDFELSAKSITRMRDLVYKKFFDNQPLLLQLLATCNEEIVYNVSLEPVTSVDEDGQEVVSTASKFNLFFAEDNKYGKLVMEVRRKLKEEFGSFYDVFTAHVKSLGLNRLLGSVIQVERDAESYANEFKNITTDVMLYVSPEEKQKILDSEIQDQMEKFEREKAIKAKMEEIAKVLMGKKEECCNCGGGCHGKNKDDDLEEDYDLNEDDGLEEDGEEDEESEFGSITDGEKWLYCLNTSDGIRVVTICPEAYWLKENLLWDGEYPGELPFVELTEAQYEIPDDVTDEDAKKQMDDLGFVWSEELLDWSQKSVEDGTKWLYCIAWSENDQTKVIAIYPEFHFKNDLHWDREYPGDLPFLALEESIHKIPDDVTDEDAKKQMDDLGFIWSDELLDSINKSGDLG